jgi:hypothetical protein
VVIWKLLIFWWALIGNRLEKQTILGGGRILANIQSGRIHHPYPSCSSFKNFRPILPFCLLVSCHVCLIFLPPDLQFHIFIFKLIWRSANRLPIPFDLGRKNTEESRDNLTLWWLTDWPPGRLVYYNSLTHFELIHLWEEMGKMWERGGGGIIQYPSPLCLSPILLSQVLHKNLIWSRMKVFQNQIKYWKNRIQAKYKFCKNV